MISALQGILEAVGTDSAVINVGGISFQVVMPASALSNVGVTGKKVRVHTHLQLREDGMVLYGFAAPEELRLFQTLMAVSGIGPRLALAMLSAMSVEGLISAIAGGNADLLKSVPGIGKKTAERIILELKDKIGAGWTTTPPRVAQENADVLAALTALGYSVAEGTRAVSAIPASEATLEEKVKLALQYLGG